MFKTVILICTLSTTPNAKDCTGATAIDLIEGPIVPNEIMCGRDGQAYVAEMANSYPDDYYLRVLCKRGPQPQNIG